MNSKKTLHEEPNCPRTLVHSGDPEQLHLQLDIANRIIEEKKFDCRNQLQKNNG